MSEAPETREVAKQNLEKAADVFQQAVYDFNQLDFHPFEAYADDRTLELLEKIKAEVDRLSAEAINDLAAGIESLAPQGDGVSRDKLNTALKEIAESAKSMQRGGLTKDFETGKKTVSLQLELKSLRKEAKEKGVKVDEYRVNRRVDRRGGRGKDRIKDLVEAYKKALGIPY
ncbi:MAG: hypothetical protein ABIH35_01660 [Patescibacteria group bacterium]